MTTAMVTGASRGIGYAAARRFLNADCDVHDLIVVARDTPAFHEAVEKLNADNQLGKRIHAHVADFADRGSVVRLTADVMSAHDRVDILVNNAGCTVPAAIQQIDFRDFDRTMHVNVYAPFTIVQELLRRGNVFGLIVNIASTAGITARSGWLTYSASKAAVISMTQVMKEELSIFGTRVTCISPGRCATDLRRLLAPEEDPSTIMQPEDVAAVIEMLASDVGRFVDSQNLIVRM